MTDPTPDEPQPQGALSAEELRAALAIAAVRPCRRGSCSLPSGEQVLCCDQRLPDFVGGIQVRRPPEDCSCLGAARAAIAALTAQAQAAPAAASGEDEALASNADGILNDYDAAMESQPDSVSNAKLIVIANYGELALSILRAMTPRLRALSAELEAAKRDADELREVIDVGYERSEVFREKVLEAVGPFAKHREWARLHEWPADIASDPMTPVLGAPGDEGAMHGEVTVGDFDRLADLAAKLKDGATARGVVASELLDDIDANKDALLDDARLSPEDVARVAKSTAQGGADD
jgi:hypothetical protein